MTANGREFPFTLAVTLDSARGAIGKITAREMGFVRVPLLEAIRITEANIAFRVGLSEGALIFRGKLRKGDVEGNVIETGMVNGSWSPVGDTIPFVMRRGGRTTENLPYEIRDTAFVNNGVRLAASLLIPKATRKTGSPGMVFVHGSGPAVRDEGNFLADHFARRGFVTLIYDKRGAGRSGGDWTNASIPDLAGDALAGVAFLRAMKAVDSKAIGLVGMSQGGWVVINAAARSPSLRFLVLQAGPVLPPTVNGLWRFKLRLGRSGIGGSDSLRALEFVKRDAVVSSTRAGYDELIRDVERVKDSAWFKALGWTPASMDDEYRRWSAIINSYNPGPDLLRVRTPGLWVYGSADLAVDGLTEATAVCASRAGTTSRRDVIVLVDADHGMKIDQPLKRIFPHVHREFTPAIDAWLDRRVFNTASTRMPEPGCPVMLGVSTPR
jgi:pimeloyl-ACP methyl ester carboxylesterase